MELTAEEAHINDTNKAWHAREAFPEPDENIGLVEAGNQMEEAFIVDEGAA